MMSIHIVTLQNRYSQSSLVAYTSKIHPIFFFLTSANAFNLGQSKILSSGKVLINFAGNMSRGQRACSMGVLFQYEQNRTEHYNLLDKYKCILSILHDLYNKTFVLPCIVINTFSNDKILDRTKLKAECCQKLFLSFIG